MEIDQKILKYLRGEEFTNSLVVNLERSKYEVRSREEVITEIIKGKDVIHIGCSDHIPVIREKMAVNKWLHKLITDNSRTCIGVDIDKESIEFVTRELGFNNVICGNIITDDLNELSAREWDYAVFGEIIEHLDNPVEFLKIFREKYGKNVKRFIITVPNIYNKKNLKNLLRYREEINSDHRFWFTPYTVAKVLVSAGFMPEKISFANLISLGKMELVIRKLKKISGMKISYPYYYFSSLIATGNMN
ncbi:MAG: class I SAM-dependent methyltransferase [Bacteroidales bacterium]|jgi:2-polyprenyl-3-methyl-5-hydroxy-6-metoxy-1,4-benzoquinol methylase|nr:class I SAM-dependent methyltransferase [Bacteroidales bacterium]